MTMMFKRRSLLMSTLFGAGYVGLRALATGIPASVLLKGTRAFADGDVSCTASASAAQYFIMSTSGNGDPINANVPGCYIDTTITHPQPTDGSMTPTKMTSGGQQYMAALPWTQLPPAVLAQTTFWHIMTNTPVHPREGDVLSLLNTTAANEMLPSLLSKSLAPCLNTIQSQPITLGASSPSEGLKFGGQALPIIPPLALKSTLTNPSGPLAGITNLQTIRDQTLSQIDDLYRSSATKAQKAYLDSLITSQSQVRGINQNLLDMLSNIMDNTVSSQITAAMALIQMNVTPVVAIHIPFGGDNHNDLLLAAEGAQTVTGVASIAQVMSSIPSNLAGKVSFMSLNVFGRTLNKTNTDGRQHNPNHQVSITIGAPFKGMVVGGVGVVGNDYGAVAIDSASGAGGSGGDIAPTDSLASFGKTVLAAVGVDSTTIGSAINGGKVVQGALA